MLKVHESTVLYVLHWFMNTITDRKHDNILTLLLILQIVLEPVT